MMSVQKHREFGKLIKTGNTMYMTQSTVITANYVLEDAQLMPFWLKKTINNL